MKDTAFILDFDLIAEQNLSIDEFLILIHGEEKLYNDSPYLLKSLEEKQFIKIINNEKILLREKAKLLIELVSIEKLKFSNQTKSFKKSNRLMNSEIDNFINDFRNKFKGLKPGSMGSLAACKDKMHRWMTENPYYTPEQILKATDIYIDSLESYKYLQQADYFIYKKDGKDEMSRLSAFIDEESTSNDWLTQLK
jgi:hypothetical protein